MKLKGCNCPHRPIDRPEKECMLEVDLRIFNTLMMIKMRKKKRSDFMKLSILTVIFAALLAGCGPNQAIRAGMWTSSHLHRDCGASQECPLPQRSTVTDVDPYCDHDSGIYNLDKCMIDLQLKPH